MADNGVLYICATPIGNLEDITLRVLRVLKEVDFIAAEDTRQTLKILNHFEIKTPLVSYHEHNKRVSGETVTKRLEGGESCALVTDAGMPCVSDPGYELVKLCAERGVSVTVCPGASAAVCAVALSGIEAGRFVFEGFLPTGGKRRAEILNALKDEARAAVIYESPKRVGATLAELAENLGGERRAAVVKEITKAFERTERGSLAELSERLAGELRGEFVIVVEGATERAISFDSLGIKEHVNVYLERGATLKEAMKAAARDRGVSKSEVYAGYLRG